MKGETICIVVALVATTYAPYALAAGLEARAFAANAPYGYAPQTGKCPSNAPTIRSASSLSMEETTWLHKRRLATVEPMRDLLSRLKIAGLDTDAYINKHRSTPSALPNVALAISGGGYRAMLNGAGVLEAFDSRTPNSKSTGHLGGLLQSATYLSGLSGGSWLVGSLYANNFTSVSQILSPGTNHGNVGDIWQFENSIFEGPATSRRASYYAGLVSDVDDKSDAGFATSITDYWGRALSFQIVNALDGGPAVTYSSIADQAWFRSGSAPLPFIIADARDAAQNLYAANTTIYTFSPWELGSEDPTIYAFAPLRYIGTNFTAGSTTTDQCTTGYDNVGFIMGTSSSLFNAALTTVNSANTTGRFSTALQNAIAEILATIGENNNDISVYKPNPFWQYDKNTGLYADANALTLVDGGEDGQNIPLHPLIQPNRHVDVIFAIDSSADTNTSFPVDKTAAGWPGGVSLIATYKRSQSSISNGTAFPSVPDVNTFFNLGLNKRPAFFGCDTSNTAGPTPLVVYLPNAPYTYLSNISTFDLELNASVYNGIILNGYNLATQGNGTLDSEWATCVGCAILSRSLERTNTKIPSVCKQCFSRLCWNGSTDRSTPSPYVPAMKINAVKSKSSSAGRLTSSLAALVVCLFVAGWTLS